MLLLGILVIVAVLLLIGGLTIASLKFLLVIGAVILVVALVVGVVQRRNIR